MYEIQGISFLFLRSLLKPSPCWEWKRELFAWKLENCFEPSRDNSDSKYTLSVNYLRVLFLDWKKKRKWKERIQSWKMKSHWLEMLFFHLHLLFHSSFFCLRYFFFISLRSPFNSSWTSSSCYFLFLFFVIWMN